MNRGFVIGLATGLTVAGASLVLANSQIQAILNDQIKVTLNGQLQEFKDETTNEIQYPITYHDRTYLPLRTVANLVGIDVDYDANTNTAILENSVFSNYYDYADGIRSIVFYEYGQFGSQYEVYNIKSGSIMSNEELMELKNISEDDINNRINKYIEDTITYVKKSWNLSEDEFNDFSEKIKNINTMSRIKIFINDKNEISLVVNCPDGTDLWFFSEVIEL